MQDLIQTLNKVRLFFSRALPPGTGGGIFKIKGALLCRGVEGNAARVLFQLGALLESDPERERGWAFVRHAAPRLCRLAPPPDSRTAIARGASILPVIVVFGLWATEAGMLENG